MTHNAIHCGADHSLAYSEDLLRELYDKIGDFAPVVIMFHEFGHHIDQLAGENQLYTISGELEADCLAGMATRGAMAAGILHVDDVREAAATLFSGGSVGGRWWDKDDHGTPEQRQAAFAIGYNGTGADCEAVGNASPGLAVQAPPFEFFVVNGSKGEQLQNAVYRLSPPGTTVKADLRGFTIGQLPGGGSASERFEAVSRDWFAGGDVTLGEAASTVEVTVADGSAEVPLNEQVSTLEGSIYAVRYEQVYDGQPLHGMLVLVVGGEDAANPAGGVVLDVYDNGDSSADWKEIHRTVLTLLNGLHLR